MLNVQWESFFFAFRGHCMVQRAVCLSFFPLLVDQSKSNLTVTRAQGKGL